MHPDLEYLIDLQLRDTERARLTAELAEAPRRVAATQAAHDKATTAVRSLETRLREEETLRRRQESDVADGRTRITKLRAQLATLSVAGQITAVEHEIGFAEAAIAKLEDEEFASLERTEAGEAALVIARETAAAAASFLDDARAEAERIKRDHTAAIRTLDAERGQLREQVSEAVLAQYDRVSKVRGSGVAEGIDGQCSACRMKVRPQRWNDLTDRSRHDLLLSCESCGRLLYWDPRRDAPVSWQPGQLSFGAVKS